MSERKFPEKIYFNDPHQNAPDFVIGKIAMEKFEFIAWLQKQETDEKGYVKLDVVRSKNGKPYLAVNEYGLNSQNSAPQDVQGETSSAPTPQPDINPATGQPYAIGEVPF